MPGAETAREAKGSLTDGGRRASSPGRKGRLLGLLEGGCALPWSWIALLLTWIILRNLLEGVLERPGVLGFDWREEVSLAMMVLHFPLFYLALFLLLSLWIHLTSGRPMARVVRAVSLGYAVLLSAPIVDGLISGGPGYDLRYLTGPGGFLIHFWNPLRAVNEVSPGQRVEIVLACLLAAFYSWTALRSRGDSAIPDSHHRTPATRLAVALLRAVCAGLGVYVISGTLGMWPSLAARMGALVTPGEMPAYDSVFRMGGLVAGESRRLAVALSLPALAALPFFLWRLNPERFVPVLRRLPWTRLLHYSAAAPLGCYLGYLVFREYLPGLFGNPLDWAAALLLWAAMAAAVLAAIAWNDLNDAGADRINDPGRPLVSGLMQPHQSRMAAAVCCSIALYLAWIVSYPALLLTAACLLLAWLYSAPPLRLKRFPGLSTATLAALTALSSMTGFSLVAGEAAAWAFPRRVLLLLLAGITLGFTAKDLKDRDGDAATGVVTLATLMAPNTARFLTALLVGAGYLLAPVVLPMGPFFTVVAVLFSAVGVGMTLRLRRPDTPLLVAFVGFVLMMAAFLEGNTALLRSRLPDDLLASHAGVVHLERDLAQIHAMDGTSLNTQVMRERAELRLGEVSGGGSPEERRDILSARLAHPRQALAASARLVELRPHFPLYWDLLFRSAMESEGPAAAVAVSRQALQRLVRPGQFLTNLAGLELKAAGATPQAERYLAGAFLFHHNPGMTRVLWGDMRLFQGRPGAAAEAYGSALDWSPNLPDAWAGLGQAKHSLGRLAEALAAFDRATALDPEDPWIRNNRGVTLRDMGRLDEALSAFAETHEGAPGLPEPVLNLGLTCEAMGRLDEAREWFKVALQLRPGWTPALQGLHRTESG